MATLHELSTVYGIQDLWDMLEIVRVNSHNRRMVDEHYKNKRNQ